MREEAFTYTAPLASGGFQEIEVKDFSKEIAFIPRPPDRLQEDDQQLIPWQPDNLSKIFSVLGSEKILAILAENTDTTVRDEITGCTFDQLPYRELELVPINEYAKLKNSETYATVCTVYVGKDGIAFNTKDSLYHTFDDKNFYITLLLPSRTNNAIQRMKGISVGDISLLHTKPMANIAQTEQQKPLIDPIALDQKKKDTVMLLPSAVFEVSLCKEGIPIPTELIATVELFAKIGWILYRQDNGDYCLFTTEKWNAKLDQISKPKIGMWDKQYAALIRHENKKMSPVSLKKNILFPENSSMRQKITASEEFIVWVYY